MKLRMQEGLAFISGSLTYQGRQLELENVIVDTGSTGSVFSVDKLNTVGFVAQPKDEIRQVHGVGGVEYVILRTTDRLSFDELEVDNFEIEIGAMDYNIAADGIVGLDFLRRAGAVIDLATLVINKHASFN